MPQRSPNPPGPHFAPPQHQARDRLRDCRVLYLVKLFCVLPAGCVGGAHTVRPHRVTVYGRRHSCVAVFVALVASPSVIDRPDRDGLLRPGRHLFTGDVLRFI